jgi:hypothetical protein
VARRPQRRREQRRRARRRSATRPSPALRALASGALSLPGLAGSATADAPAERIRADYSFSLYSEDDMPASKVVSGSNRRYEIEAHQIRLSAPIADRFDLGWDFTYETMSGATPWYIEPDSDGAPLQVMTGATIEEERIDTSLNGNWFLDSGRIGVRGGISDENDYFAGYGFLDGERHFNEKNTTLSSGAGFSLDTIEPTGGGTEGRVVKEHKQTYSVFAGISQILGRSSALNSTVSYQLARGFLSDPYKRVIVPDAIGTPVPTPDSRPDMRNQFTWLTRYRHHFESLGATFHGDYQFYIDDWEVSSHTFEVAWYQGLWSWLRVVPSFRYYSQSQASFYAPYFENRPGSGHWSSDYRLAPFGALSWRIRSETRFTTWSLDWLASIAYERYVSSADYALGSVGTENPGLVSYGLLSLTLSGRF